MRRSCSRHCGATVCGCARAFVVELDDLSVSAWLRTLTSVRLVMATRLGIVDDDDERPDDPRFGVYDWLGFRLEGLLQALED